MEIRRLNTLRGLAALIVVISHYSNAAGLWDKTLGSGAGYLGVMLFFLLSGFLMSYLNFGQQPNTGNVRSFAVARIARVVPLFYVLTIASFALSSLAPPPYNKALYNIDGVPSLLSHLLFLHGESVLWTIPPEIQFYALFALAWIFHGRFGRNLYWPIALVWITDFFYGFNDETSTIAGLSFTPSITKALPYFITGSILGQVYQHNKVPRDAMSNYYLLALAFIPLLYPSIFFKVTGRYFAWWDTNVLIVLTAVFFAVVFLVPDKNILLENTIGDFFGKVSYSLYLLHQPVLDVLERFKLPESVFSLLLFIAMSTIAAYLSFIVIEAPSRNSIRRLFSKQTA